MLVRHLRLVHGYLPGKNLHLKCVQTGCGSVFGTFSGFRKHLNTKHTEYIDKQVDTDAIVSSAGETMAAHRDETDTTLVVDEMATTSELLRNSNRNTLDMCATAIAQLKATGLSQSTVNSFVSTMEEVVSEIHSQAEDAALQCLSAQDTENKNKIKQALEKLENPFTSLNSEAKRNKHYRDRWGNVEPIEKVLGTRFDSRRNRTTGTYDQVIVTDKFAYVPILETLKMIFQNPELVQDMLKPRYMPKKGVFADLRDGTYFKESPIFSKKFPCRFRFFMTTLKRQIPWVLKRVYTN